MSRRTVYNRYTDSFKATAVRLSLEAQIRTKDVAESLDIHPYMLSRWKKEWREGKIMAKGKAPPVDPELASELKRLRKLERAHAQLQMEHSLLKKAIRFSLKQKQTSSRSSTRTGKNTPSS